MDTDTAGSPQTCQCGNPAARFRSKKNNENNGRWFYTCASKRCSYFLWDPNWKPGDAQGSASGGATGGSGNGQNPRQFWQRNNAAKSSSTSSGSTTTNGKANGAGGQNHAGNTSNPFIKAQQRGGAENHSYNNFNKNNNRNNNNAGTSSDADIEIHITVAGQGLVAIAAPKVGRVGSVLGQRIGTYWDSDRHCWKAPMRDHDKIAKELAQFGKVVPVPKLVLAVFAETSSYEDTDKANAESETSAESYVSIPTMAKRSILDSMEREIEPSLFKRLLPFQREGIRKVISRKGRALIADEMGLGKTIQAIALCSYYHESWPCLVICPSSLRHNWRNEIVKWLHLPKEKVVVVDTGKEARDLLTNEDISFYIFSYDIASKKDINRLLMMLKFQIVICDESHYLKNKDAKRTQMLLPLIKSAKYALLLSGTPALSRPIELYTQVSSLIVPKYMNSMDFAMRYCNARMTRFGWDFTGSSNMDELHVFLDRTILIRRQKDQVLQQLPKKIRHCVNVKLDANSMVRMAKLNERFKEVNTKIELSKMKGDEKGEREATIVRRTTMIEMYTETGRGKLHAIKHHISELIKHHPEKKFIVFGHHQEVLDEIQHFLEESQIAFIRIDGGTNQKERQNLVDRFQDKDHVKCALLSLTAAGVGLTLTRADQVIFSELFWNPAQLFQGEDRAHRIGRIGDVHVFYYIAEKSLDDIQWPLLEKKLKIVTQSLDGTKKSIDSVSSVMKDGNAVAANGKSGKANGNKTIDGMFNKIKPLEMTSNMTSHGGMNEELPGNDDIDIDAISSHMAANIETTEDGSFIVRESQDNDDEDVGGATVGKKSNAQSEVIAIDDSLLDDIAILSQQEGGKLIGSNDNLVEETVDQVPLAGSSSSNSHSSSIPLAQVLQSKIANHTQAPPTPAANSKPLKGQQDEFDEFDEFDADFDDSMMDALDTLEAIERGARDPKRPLPEPNQTEGARKVRKRFVI